jgi:hypothetical protein
MLSVRSLSPPIPPRLDPPPKFVQGDPKLFAEELRAKKKRIFFNALAFLKRFVASLSKKELSTFDF